MSHASTDAVAEMLRGFARVAVAVSGGIDSLTLATIAGRGHDSAGMFHAVSPAVPPEATDRVRDFAAREGWRLQLIDAATLSRLTQEQKQGLTQAVGAVLAAALEFPEVSLAPYRVGSAFLVKQIA